MESEKLLTFKPVISSKAALAMAVAKIKFIHENSEELNSKNKIFTDDANNTLGESFFNEFEKFSDKDYLKSVVEGFKSEPFAINLLKSCKSLDVSIFMSDVCENINRGFLDLESKNIKDNDFVIMYSKEYAATIYTLKDRATIGQEDEVRAMGAKIFKDFKSDPSLFVKFLNEIKLNDQIQNFKSVWLWSMDAVLREAVKNNSVKQFIVELVSVEYGEFVRVSNIFDVLE
jgi:hypothetical protein